jgi:hypothetical protein
MPIEDLRKLYTPSTSIINVPTPKQEEEEEEEEEEDEEEISTSEEDSSDQDEDSGYQRLLIAEHPTSSTNKGINKNLNFAYFR